MRATPQERSLIRPFATLGPAAEVVVTQTTETKPSGRVVFHVEAAALSYVARETTKRAAMLTALRLLGRVERAAAKGRAA